MAEDDKKREKEQSNILKAGENKLNKVLKTILLKAINNAKEC